MLLLLEELLELEIELELEVCAKKDSLAIKFPSLSKKFTVVTRES